jgi:hypothetical protein
LSEAPAGAADARYRVDARSLPFTPSWFWEVVDTSQGSFVENSLALSRTVYESSDDAVAAGLRYLEAASDEP